MDCFIGEAVNSGCALLCYLPLEVNMTTMYILHSRERSILLAELVKHDVYIVVLVYSTST